MPTGIPKAGYRKTDKYKARTLQDIEIDLQGKAPGLIAELEKLTKPIECPHCGNRIEIIDKDVAMYLIDHAIGKAKMRQEVDITTTMVLNADQIDSVIKNNLPQKVSMYREEIRGLLPEANL